jgi:hypothetical protein
MIDFKTKTCGSGKGGWTKKELKEICENLLISSYGSKNDLCNRLNNYYNSKQFSNLPVEIQLGIMQSLDARDLKNLILSNKKSSEIRKNNPSTLNPLLNSLKVFSARKIEVEVKYPVDLKTLSKNSSVKYRVDYLNEYIKKNKITKNLVKGDIIYNIYYQDNEEENPEDIDDIPVLFNGSKLISLEKNVIIPKDFLIFTGNFDPLYWDQHDEIDSYFLKFYTDFSKLDFISYKKESGIFYYEILFNEETYTIVSDKNLKNKKIILLEIDMDGSDLMAGHFLQYLSG